MTIQELTSRFLRAQTEVHNIVCGLQAGIQRVKVEKIYDDLANIWAEIEAMSSEQKNLTIINYKL